MICHMLPQISGILRPPQHAQNVPRCGGAVRTLVVSVQGFQVLLHLPHQRRDALC